MHNKQNPTLTATLLAARWRTASSCATCVAPEAPDCAAGSPDCWIERCPQSAAGGKAPLSGTADTGTQKGFIVRPAYRTMHCRLKSKHINITIISYFISAVYITSYGTRVRHTTLQNVLRVASTILYVRYCFIDSPNWQSDATTDDQKQKLVQSVLPTVSKK